MSHNTSHKGWLSDLGQRDAISPVIIGGRVSRTVGKMEEKVCRGVDRGLNTWQI